MLDWQAILYAVLVACFAVGAFFYKDMKTKLEVLTRDVFDFKLHAAQTYVTGETLQRTMEDLKRDVGSVNDAVLRIEARLNLQLDRRPPAP